MTKRKARKAVKRRRSARPTDGTPRPDSAARALTDARVARIRELQGVDCTVQSTNGTDSAMKQPETTQEARRPQNRSRPRPNATAPAGGPGRPLQRGWTDHAAAAGYLLRQWPPQPQLHAVIEIVSASRREGWIARMTREGRQWVNDDRRDGDVRRYAPSAWEDGVYEIECARVRAPGEPGRLYAERVNGAFIRWTCSGWRAREAVQAPTATLVPATPTPAQSAPDWHAAYVAAATAYRQLVVEHAALKAAYAAEHGTLQAAYDVLSEKYATLERTQLGHVGADRRASTVAKAGDDVEIDPAIAARIAALDLD